MKMLLRVGVEMSGKWSNNPADQNYSKNCLKQHCHLFKISEFEALGSSIYTGLL